MYSNFMHKQQHYAFFSDQVLHYKDWLIEQIIGKDVNYTLHNHLIRSSLLLSPHIGWATEGQQDSSNAMRNCIKDVTSSKALKFFCKKERDIFCLEKMQIL